MGESRRVYSCAEGDHRAKVVARPEAQGYRVKLAGG
jgi:hypothetical protein